MKFIVDKRNYIIMFIIIVLIFWIITLSNNKPHIKSFKFEDKVITYEIYENISERKVYNKIKDIYKEYENYDEKLNGKLDSNMLAFLEYGRILYNKTNGYVDITSGDVISNIGNGYVYETKINDLTYKNNRLTSKINFNIDNIMASYATGDVIDYFNLMGIKKYIINIDGDIIAGSKYSDKNYSISISDPSSSKVLKIVNFQNKSMTTLSGENMVNLKTSSLEKLYDTVVVISDDILTSNMVANNVYFLSVEEGKEVAKKFGSEILWYKDGQIYMTDNFSKYF